MAEEARIEAMVLAAGESRRLGEPKALLSFGGRPALELILDALRAAGVGAGVVVVGEHAEALDAAVDPTPLAWAHNTAPERGRMSSVLEGLRHLTPGTDVLLWPVDRPLASPETVAALVAETALAHSSEGVILPEFRSGRGHPVILRASLRPALASAPPDANLREVIRAAGARRRPVPVDDPGIHFDLDTPDAYEEALAWWRRARA